MKFLLSILTVILAPVVASAQTQEPFTFTRTIDGFLNYVIYLAGRALPLLILAALVLLLYGIVINFFFQSDDTKRKEGKQFIMWGIVALFVMVSVWGLVNILKSTFSLDNETIPVAPAIPYQKAPEAVPSL
jgi:cytochrome c biogenesis protein CcdA